VENKSYLMAALALVIALSGGVYAYTYTSGIETIGITDPTGDIATVNAAASQPNWDSVLTPVTNTLNFRPNATGDENGIDEQFPASGAHWDKVDEETADDDSTYVASNSPSWKEDLYHIPNHSTQTAGGDINYVEVYMVCRATANATQDSVYVHIHTNGTGYNGATENMTPSYATYSYQWTKNPSANTTWTWDEIDNLQIGAGLRQPIGGEYTRCTQVYAEVSFDAPPLSGNTPTGDLFEIDEDADYNGDLQMRVYLTNTGSLQKAYDELNIELYLEDSEEAGETPNYQLLTLENGVVTFTLKDPIGDSHTLSVTGGTYTRTSRETSEWEAEWTVTPELFCEATQR
jgi:hypothetical protein